MTLTTFLVTLTNMKNTLKKQPERTCAVCRKKGEKQNFIKLVRTDNEIVIDKEQKINGRGMYVCNSKECIQKAIKTKAPNRCFKREVSEKVYEELKSFEESK